MFLLELDLELRHSFGMHGLGGVQALDLGGRLAKIAERTFLCDFRWTEMCVTWTVEQ